MAAPGRRLTAALLALALGASAVVASGGVASAKTTGATKSKVANARVPSLCGHPAGRLVNGSLPGIGPNDGGVGLVKNKVAFGQLRKGQKRSAAAVLWCTWGLHSWPENVVVYSPRMKVIGTFRLGSLTQGESQRVRKVWIKKRVLHVQVVSISAPGEAASYGTRSASLTMKWSKKKKRMTLRSKRVYTERSAASRLLAATSKGDRTKALKYGSPAVVDTMIRYSKSAGLGYKLDSCFGPASTEWGWTISDPYGSYSRACITKIGSIVLYMSKTSWRTWKVKEVRPLSTH